jgi:hypothetical protein
MLSPLSPLGVDSSGSKLRAFALVALKKIVLSAAGAAGAKLGERIIDWALGNEESDEEEPESPPQAGPGGGQS